MSRILIVDDEPLVLAGYLRELRDRFDVRTAESATEGLALFENEGPFAVVVSDMMMPGMNGARFLAKIRRLAPDTVRIMLTGCNDRDTAVQAINDGNVHRFHNKPCPADVLALSLDDGIELHRQQVDHSYGVQRLLAESDELEQELKLAYTRAESAELARKAILATVGHELRTPLNHVLGLSDMIRSGLSNQMKTTEYAADIYRSGSELHEKIENILTLAQLDSGDLQFDEGQIALRPLVEDCVHLMTEAAAERRIGLAVEIPSPRIVIHGDEVLLKRCLLNLLSNALKFSAEGGLVTVGAGFDNDGGLVIAVHDEGAGFNGADLDLVLQPFSQGDSRLERCFEGLGLGLPLTRALIEQHGGYLMMDSTPGAGATVGIRLPDIRIERDQGNQSAA